ncbi:uncharacterized domain 1-containing protein [Paracoccus isoporae]|uniref:Uncharacterized domain 1-containing protein n=1 Tax=Paracoccus isoporae TaxID=591205 RepID=A0A1G7HRJ2_9RHOB|nr:PaaI family thioesterase [Paracoccus isoporae]SDF02619.1 uncharacterized domain 1-containing protein [Paracoccus isoporae]
MMDNLSYTAPAAALSDLPLDFSGASGLVGYLSWLPETGGACSMEIGPQHLNRLGNLHGGFVCMLLDNGCGTAVRREIGQIDARVVTASLTVHHVDAVSAGRVTARGRVTGGGQTTKFAEAELRDTAGRLIATARAVFAVMRTQ